MNCTRTRNLLMCFVDSELDAAGAADVELHLQQCDECRRRYEQESRLEQALQRKMRLESCPREAWQRVLAVLSPEKADLQRRVRHLTWSVAAAACLLLTLSIALWEGKADGDGAASVAAASIKGRSGAALVRDLLAVHAAGVAGEAVPTREAAQALLEQQGFGALLVPAIDAHEGHDLELVGAREEKVLGQPAVSLALRCCGHDLSVIVLRASVLARLPDFALPASGAAPVAVPLGVLPARALQWKALFVAVLGEDEPHDDWLAHALRS